MLEGRKKSKFWLEPGVEPGTTRILGSGFMSLLDKLPKRVSYH